MHEEDVGGNGPCFFAVVAVDVDCEVEIKGCFLEGGVAWYGCYVGVSEAFDAESDACMEFFSEDDDACHGVEVGGGDVYIEWGGHACYFVGLHNDAEFDAGFEAYVSVDFEGGGVLEVEVVGVGGCS